MPQASGAKPACHALAGGAICNHHRMMKTHLVTTLSLCLLLLPIAQARAADCDEAQAKTIGELNAALSTKAVDIINLAASDDDSGRLAELVDPVATFSLGAGDVGRPLGSGVAAARALARLMKADSYRFYLWSSIPMQISAPCGAAEVKVEFIDTAGGNAYPLTFAFEHGRLIKAEGWTQSFHAGSLRRAAN